MGKFFWIGFAIAAAAAVYMFWFRRSSDDVRDDFMSAASTARDYASDMADRAGDQVSKAREAANV